MKSGDIFDIIYCKMSKKGLFLLILSISCLTSQAAWWSFGSDEEEKKPPKVSELMRPVTRLIDQASEQQADGKPIEAVETYRKALAELNRIAAADPERLKKPEFTTVRTKRAYVSAMIDSLLIEDAKRSAKAISVTDTAALERQFAKESGQPLPPEVKPEEPQAAPASKAVTPKASTSKASSTAQSASQATKTAATATSKKPEAQVRKASPQVKRDRVAELKKILAKNPKDKRARILLANEDLKKKDYEAAELTLQGVLADYPKDVGAMNLLAMVQLSAGNTTEAQNLLNEVIISNPKSYYAYYNMAKLILRTQKDDSAKLTAGRYYRTGRTYASGPVDDYLEARTK